MSINVHKLTSQSQNHDRVCRPRDFKLLPFLSVDKISLIPKFLSNVAFSFIRSNWKSIKYQASRLRKISGPAFLNHRARVEPSLQTCVGDERFNLILTFLVLLTNYRRMWFEENKVVADWDHKLLNDFKNWWTSFKAEPMMYQLNIQLPETSK